MPKWLCLFISCNCLPETQYKTGDNDKTTLYIFSCCLFKTGYLGAFHSNSQAIVLNLTHNLISNVCPTKPKPLHMHLFDVSVNMVKKVTKNCFFHLKKLKLINLSHNHILELQTSSFNNISSFLEINFESNFLCLLILTK